MKLTITRIVVGALVFAGTVFAADTNAPEKNKPAVNLVPALGPEAWSPSKDTQARFDEKDGRKVVEIVVPPDVKSSFQKVQCLVEGGAFANRSFRLKVEVRAREVKGGVGPYAVIECLDAKRQRLKVISSITSPQNGEEDWMTLEAFGEAPAGTVALRVCLLLHANGIAWFANPRLERNPSSADWPDYGTAPRLLKLGKEPVTTSLLGVGFHHMVDARFAGSEAEFELCYQRWDDLNPSFARVNHGVDYDKAKLDFMARHLLRMQKTGTLFYITTWSAPMLETAAEVDAYAKKIADDLEYLIREKGCTGIRWYCIANELQLVGKGWGAMLNDLPRFQRYNEVLFAEFKKRKLNVELLATDASPVGNWGTITWATKNMADVSGAYGGHHYIAEFEPRSLDFAPWWESRIRNVIGPAKAQKKPFIMGEFGSKQDGSVKNGVKLDRCVYYETPEEPWVGLQVSEAVIGALRSGVDAIGYWTFMDFPDFSYGPKYQNKWGLFRNSGNDRSFRAPYYAYGLLTRAFRSGLKIYPLDTEDPRIRAVAGQKPDGKWVVALVNRNSHPVSLKLPFDSSRNWQAGRYQPDHLKPGPAGLLAPWENLSGNEVLTAADEQVVLMEL